MINCDATACVFPFPRYATQPHMLQPKQSEIKAANYEELCTWRGRVVMVMTSLQAIDTIIIYQWIRTGPKHFRDQTIAVSRPSRNPSLKKGGMGRPTGHLDRRESWTVVRGFGLVAYFFEHGRLWISTAVLQGWIFLMSNRVTSDISCVFFLLEVVNACFLKALELGVRS